MPPSPSLSALDPNTQAFPVLTPTQIDRIRPLGHIRGVQSGETLYKPGITAVRLNFLPSLITIAESVD